MTPAPFNPGALAGGGGNPSGYNMPSVMGGTGSTTPGVPGVAEPWPGGTTMPLAGSAFSGTPFSLLPFSGSNPQVLNSLKQAGYPSYIAGMLADFLQGGAGFSPQVMQWLFQAMQPQIQQGQANILEQFGSAGLGMSSPAAYGLSNYLGQVNLNQEQIAAQLYEQAVQNYLDILLGGNKLALAKASVPQQGLGSLIGGAGQLLGSLSQIGNSGGSSAATDAAMVLATG